MLENLNTWFAIPLQLTGFGFAIWQIMRARQDAAAARKAAVNAKDASLATQRALRHNYLLVLLPQVSQAETDLDWAISKGEVHLMAHFLGHWSRQVSGLLGHADQLKILDKEMVDDMRESIELAYTAKLAVQHADDGVADELRAAQLAIARVSARLGELTSTLTSNVPRDLHHDIDSFAGN